MTTELSVQDDMIDIHIPFLTVASSSKQILPMKISFSLLAFGVLALGFSSFDKAWAVDPIFTHKTPDGIGTLVATDDSILAPIPAAIQPFPLVTPEPALLQNILQFSDEILTYLSDKSNDKDHTYYEAGIWHHVNDKVLDRWPYGAGPAGLAAQLWRWRQTHPETMDAAAKARQPWLQKVAVETFERLIKDHQLPNGDLTDLGASHREFFTIDFISTYLIFKDTFDAATKERWLDVMKRQVDFMMKTGDLPNPEAPGWKATDGWYTNGNVEVSEVSWLYLVWQATGDQKYKDLLELDWKHTLRPTPERWNGYGLYYFKLSTKADGSDGSAFVTEAAVAPGFDPGYSGLQLSIVARYYLKSHDPRALKLTNLIFNTLLPHLSPETMIMDAQYGSRHSEILPFSMCAPAILAWMGGRSDILPMLDDQFNKGMKPFMLRNAKDNEGNPATYRSYGFDLAALIEAAYEIEQAKKIR